MYHQRKAATHLDGSPVFQTQGDRKNERDVAAALEAHWKCAIRGFGMLSPVDWYAERDGRLVGLLELKSRPHPHDKYPTVFLNIRKWLALKLGSIGMGCPSLFVVRFADGIWWIKVDVIDARNCRIGGCARVVKSHSDIEPIIEVPVDTMNKL